MARPSSVLRSVEGGGLMFWCPGCDEAHLIRTGAGTGPRWGYNGKAAAPTFTPSVLVRSGHHLPEHQPGKPCWCTYNAEHPDEEPVFTCDVCHSFVTDGMIRFLGDCTHAMAGQTVPLPDYPERA